MLELRRVRCQWVLTRSKNSSPRLHTSPSLPPAALLHPSTAQTPGVPGLRTTLTMAFSGNQKVGCSPWGWELSEHLGLVSFCVVSPPRAAAVRFWDLFIPKAV